MRVLWEWFCQLQGSQVSLSTEAFWQSSLRRMWPRSPERETAQSQWGTSGGNTPAFYLVFNPLMEIYWQEAKNEKGTRGHRPGGGVQGKARVPGSQRGRSLRVISRSHWTRVLYPEQLLWGWLLFQNAYDVIGFSQSENFYFQCKLRGAWMYFPPSSSAFANEGTETQWGEMICPKLPNSDCREKKPGCPSSGFIKRNLVHFKIYIYIFLSAPWWFSWFIC